MCMASEWLFTNWIKSTSVHALPTADFSLAATDNDGDAFTWNEPGSAGFEQLLRWTVPCPPRRSG